MSVPLPEKDIPVNVQVATDDDYRFSGALNLTDFLARDLAGVSLTHVQNNPFQPDVLYRGFTSSFLLGTPAGLSVFVDGHVLMNRWRIRSIGISFPPDILVDTYILHAGTKCAFVKS